MKNNYVTVKWFVLLLIIICGNETYGRPVGLTEAMDNAAEFLRANGKSGTLKTTQNGAKLYSQSATASNQQPYYVFNVGEDNGFLIVSGDDRAETVLGYSDNGSFDYDDIPSNVQAWLCEYADQIEYLWSDGSLTNSENQLKEVSYTDIPPLVQSKWNQGYPYNRLLPNIYPSEYGYDENFTTSARLVTGCVATAMAQVMNFHKYPAKGKGSHSFTVYYRFNKDGSYSKSRIGSNKNVVHSADFGNTFYDWDNMKSVYTGKENPDDVSVLAVATIMKHCGVAVDMDYGTSNEGGSGAYASKISSALTDYFMYDDDVRLVEKNTNSMTDQKWVELIYNELANSRPVIYTGYGSGGHAFVCDGYQTDNENNHFFHINWGWSGKYDGYFQFSALTPANGHNYSSSQEAVVGIKPKFIEEGIVLDKYVISIQEQETATVTATVVPVDTGKVFWKSNNPSVATVSEEGVISAISIGQTTILATNLRCDTAVCQVTVTENIELAANAFKNNHQAILAKKVRNVTCDDSTAINNALADYALLSTAVQSSLSNQYNLLTSLKERVVELKRIEDEERAAAEALAAEILRFRTDNDSILSKPEDQIVITDSVIIDTALAAYGRLSLKAAAELQPEKELLDSYKLIVLELKRIEDEEKERLAQTDLILFEGKSQIYTITGQKIERIMSPGLYIIDGRKVLIDRVQ